MDAAADAGLPEMQPRRPRADRRSVGELGSVVSVRGLREPLHRADDAFEV